jgi:16S rRNA processing protein RimM
LGIVGAPFGLKGFVKVKPFSGESGHFSRLDKIILKQGEKEESWEIDETITQGENLLIHFAGINSPEAAGKLKGAEIIAGREYAAPLKDGEFYIEDLKGLSVISKEGKVLANIINVLEGGGGFLTELELPGGEKRLAPFRKEFFGDVDFKAGNIVMLESWILE